MRIERIRVKSLKEIMSFFQLVYGTVHVLGNDEDLIRWQYQSEDSEYLNFLVARDASEICGVIGVIPSSHFDAELESVGGTWLTTWQVLPTSRGVIGISLFKAALMQYGLRGGPIGTIGLKPSTIPMYKALNFEVGKMARHVFLNPRLSHYSLLTGSHSEIESLRKPGATEVNQYWLKVTMSDIQQLSDAGSNQTPAKSVKYLVKRYLLHPRYQYLVYSRQNQNDPMYVVLRQVSHNGQIAFRLVDVCGTPESFNGLNGLFRDLLENSGAQYVDCMHLGFGNQLSRAGFSEVSSENPVQIPHYFEPFSARNQEVWYAIRQGDTQNQLIIFLGDGDQDRPRLASLSLTGP